MIDDNIVDPWPPDVRNALLRLEQGDVLIGDIPLGYYGRRATATTVGASLLATDALHFVEISPSPDAWIITMQSCDIAEEHRPRPLFPFLRTSPVYRYPSVGPVVNFELSNIGIAYQMKLTGSAFTHGTWVADLRYEQPIDKGLVVGTEIRKGFATVCEARMFGERVSRQAGRPAFDSDIDDVIVDSLRRYFRKREPMRNAMIDAGLREIRLRVSNEPREVEVIIVLDNGGDPNVARAALNDWYYKAYKQCEQRSIGLQAIRIGTMAMLPYEAGATSERILLEWIIPRSSGTGGAEQGAPNAAAAVALLPAFGEATSIDPEV